MRIFEITKSEAVAQPVEDFAEAGALLSEVPLEGPRAHAELLGDHCCLYLAAGKHAEQLNFHQPPQSGGGTPLRE